MPERTERTCDGQLYRLLYGASPCLILAATDARHASGIQEFTNVETILFDFDQGGTLRRGSERLRLADLLSPPSCPLILLAVSTTGRQNLSGLCRWWQDAGPAMLPEIRACRNDSTIEEISIVALRNLLLATCDSKRIVSQRVADLHIQITGLRTEIEELGTALSLLRGEGGIGLVPFLLTEPTRDALSTQNQHGVVGFQFAVRVQGLARLDLHFVRAPEASGILQIQLNATDREIALGYWNLPYEAASDWVKLLFPRAVTSQSSFVQLRVEAKTISGCAPQLSMSNHFVQPKGVNFVDKHTERHRLPAMRMYRGRPGIAQAALYWCDRNL